MANKFINPEERNSMIIRFILIYIVCILCAILPMIYLFSLPDKAFESLKASDQYIKGQKEQIERYQVIMSRLDQYLKDKKLEKEYRTDIDNLYVFAKDSIDENNLYKNLFLKLADLYEGIKIYSENSAKFDELKGDYGTLDAANKALTQEYKNLQRDFDTYKALHP